MKYLVVSYSHTGNNALLAKSLAETLDSDHRVLEEVKKRRIITIVLDVVFNRTPAVRSLDKDVSKYDCVIFAGPIWFGKIATPFRAFLKLQKERIRSYAYVSLSAGANGVAPQVAEELQKYTGMKPAALVHHLASDLVPYDQRGNRKILDAYRLNTKDAELLLDKTAFEIRKSIPQII